MKERKIGCKNRFKMFWIMWVTTAMPCSTHSYIQEEFSSRSMENLHQVANALLPDVQGMLPGWACHYVLPIPREATFLPRGPKEQRKSPGGTGTWVPGKNYHTLFQAAIHTYSPGPAIFAWVQALHLFHRLRFLCHHKLWLFDLLC